MKLPEFILAALIPLLGQWADGSIPLAPKRALYTLLALLGTEGRAWLKTTQTTLDEKMFETLCAEAEQEFKESGLFAEGTFEALDKFVEFKTELSA